MFQLYLFNIPWRTWGTLLCLLILNTSTCIHSWDLAVASDKGLNLLTLDGEVESAHFEDDALSEMYAVAFDPTLQRVFFSLNEDEKAGHRNISIYAYSLSHNTTSIIVHDLPHKAEGLAFDTAKEVLYWTDGNGHTIRKRSMRGEDSELQTDVLLHLPDQVPQGIAVSHCHRALFWTNSNHLNGSINRAELDGTKHVEIVTKDVYVALGITVDEAYGKVYWTDDLLGIHYRIERCSVDGSQRELVIQSTKQQPLWVALAGNALVWSDTLGDKVYGLSTDMTFPNHTEVKLEPHLLYTYPGFKPTGVSANRNVTVSCVPLKILRTHEPEEVEETAVVGGGGEEAVEFCLNDGTRNGAVCRCKKGFGGKHCEVPLCYNRCLHGAKCIVDRQGYPECQCQPGYEGRRCERDVCEEYCLNGGRCYIEAMQPSCKCSDTSTGQRCEITARLAVPPSTNDVPIIAALGAVGGALFVAVLILAWRVVVLRRRPRVKKRYIVNKGKRGQTPMTSRPPAVEQCEITIENCCNMNICETPCFEPNVRTTKSTGKKTEDRKNLLNNMEEQSVSD